MTPEQELRLEQVETLLAQLVRSDRYLSEKHFQLLDGRNIQVGVSVGTKIGTAATQKIGFYGTAPVAQQTLAVSPTATQISAVLAALGLTTP